jgi:hypothetical protein
MVLCGVKSEEQLLNAAAKINRAGIKYRLFRESDLDGSATALATDIVYGENRKYFKRFQAWRPQENLAV